MTETYAQPRIEILCRTGDGPWDAIRIYASESSIPTVAVHVDGSVSYGPDANPGENAESFWKILMDAPAFQPIKYRLLVENEKNGQ